MKKFLAILAATLSFMTGVSAQETVEHRLFPGSSQGQRAPRQSKDELKAQIDSLNAVIRALESELGIRDSLHAKMAERVEDAERKASQMATPVYSVEMTDSLLNVYYVNKQMSDFQDIQEVSMFMNDSVRFTTDVADSVLIERLKAMNSYITLPFNGTVKNYMVLYSEKNQAKMRRMLSLAAYYFPLFEETLSRYDMPLELKYMSIIESALNPVAKSRAGARGIWQFMYNTGKQYGLKINSFVDERLDVEKAADAAARYMMDAYNIFGDWALAISSYNCGAGNVNKAIHRSGRRDFWSIYPYLPRETRGYVPAFVGAMYGMTYYKEYGIVPDAPMMPAQTDTFHIGRNLHFEQIRDLVGVPVELLRELNPQYIHDIIPGNDGEYILKLPFNYSNAFLDVQDTIYTHRLDSLMSPAILKSIESGSGVIGGNGEMIRYKVKSGDYLGKLASRYHVSVAQIKKWNHLKSNDLRVGQVLTIYKGGVMPSPKPTPAPAPAPAPKQESKPEPQTEAPAPAADSSQTAVPADSSAMQPVVPDSTSVQVETIPDSTSAGAAAVNQGESAPEQTVKPAEAEEAKAEEPKEEFTTYTVKKGDSLYGITKKFPGVTMDEIKELNGIKGNQINIGAKLKIPVR